MISPQGNPKHLQLHPYEQQGTKIYIGIVSLYGECIPMECLYPVSDMDIYKNQSLALSTCTLLQHFINNAIARSPVTVDDINLVVSKQQTQPEHEPTQGFSSIQH